jgi:hypothetical protein
MHLLSMPGNGCDTVCFSKALEVFYQLAYAVTLVYGAGSVNGIEGFFRSAYDTDPFS